MNLIPETRHSLIMRLLNEQDADAWNEFTRIYQPLVFRLVRSKGLQDADSDEVVQEVLIAVSNAIGRWDPNRERGRFRDWLFRIARNLVINFITRRKHKPIGTGGSGMNEFLRQHCDPQSLESAEFDLEYRREIFHLAALDVRKQVKEKTWSAFWMTAVEGRSSSDVARALNMSCGAIHIARSRVIGRVKKYVSDHSELSEAGRAFESGGNDGR